MKKDFSSLAVVSLHSGCLLSEFSEMQELADWIVGRLVWTHELAYPDFTARLRNQLENEHPILLRIKLPLINRENWKDAVQHVVEQLGKRLSITKGANLRTESPIESLHRTLSSL